MRSPKEQSLRKLSGKRTAVIEKIWREAFKRECSPKEEDESEIIQLH